MELLPPSVPDIASLNLLGDILNVRSSAQSATTLRLRLVDRDFSWQELADLAAGQGVISPIIWELRRRHLLLPLPQRLRASSAEHPTAALLKVYQQYQERRNRCRAQLSGIISALNAAGIAPLLLKGARYLVAPHTPWHEARDMRDLDLLVRQEDAADATKTLAQAGYRSDNDSFPTDQHLPLLWLADAPSAVELHTEGLSFSARQILPTTDIWRHAHRRETDHGVFFTLPDEWQLLVGVLHHQISDHGHARHILAIKALWEFASLGSELSEAGWDAVIRHMDASNRLDVLGSFAAQAEQLFGFDPPTNLSISRDASAHAAKTFKRALQPYALRRSYFLADQLRFGFSREAMAVRYGDRRITLRTLGRHLAFLRQHYRGRFLQRITGRGDKFS